MRRAAPLLLGLLGLSQGVAQPPPGEFSEEVSVGYVLVPVSVRSRTGHVEGLAREDFHLTVDGRPVAVESFDLGAEVPLRLALLQDLSGSMDLGSKLEQSRQAVRCLLARAKPGDRHALASFAGRRLQVEVPFTGEVEPLLDAIAVWRPYGVTALHDAVARIPQIAVSRQAPNAAAVLLTDGVENASDLAPAEARDIVRRARVPVYVLGFGDVGDTGEEASDLARYAGVLRRLATLTGGRYFPLGREVAIERVCESISVELRSRYVLGFSTAAQGKVAFRRIRVSVLRPGLRIGHRQGYTGTPPG